MDSDKKKAEDVAPSRRRFVSTVATGIAASAAVAPALAQQSAGAAGPRTRSRRALSGATLPQAVATLAGPGQQDDAASRPRRDHLPRQRGGLDLLVNNASRQKSVDSILDISTADFDWTFKTNVYAMFWITKAAVPHMKAGSCIINTASQQAFDPSENLVDYAMTKAADESSFTTGHVYGVSGGNGQ